MPLSRSVERGRRGEDHEGEKRLEGVPTCRQMKYFQYLCLERSCLWGRKPIFKVILPSKTWDMLSKSTHMYFCINPQYQIVIQMTNFCVMESILLNLEFQRKRWNNT